MTITERRTKIDFAQSLRRIIEIYPDSEVIRVVLDNCDTHERNENAAPMDWRFTTEDARRKFVRLYSLVSASLTTGACIQNPVQGNLPKGGTLHHVTISCCNPELNPREINLGWSF